MSNFSILSFRVFSLDYSRVKVASAATMRPVKAYRGVRRTGCEEADGVRLTRLQGKRCRHKMK